MSHWLRGRRLFFISQRFFVLWSQIAGATRDDSGIAGGGSYGRNGLGAGLCTGYRWAGGSLAYPEAKH